MIRLDAFTRVFHLDGQKLRTWCRLLGLKIEDDQVENQATERLVMMRYLLDKLGEAEALALVGLVFEDVQGPIPVFSIVNECLLVIGADEAMYLMRTGEKADTRPEQVYTSLAVNVEAFASAIAASSRRSQDEERLARDEDGRRSPAADPVSSSSGPADP